VALGTVLTIKKDEIRVAATQAFGVPNALNMAKKNMGKENRIKEIITESEALL